MRPHALSLLLLASILLFVHAGARSHAVLINTSRPANALDPLAGVDATELSQVMRFFPGTAEAFALVKRKLKRREPINIAAVGGSITAGAMLAGAPTYMQLWRDALQARFPTADGRNHTYVDLGYHAHDSQTLRDCFQRYWATRSPGLRPSEVDVWVLETAVTDVVLVDGSSPQQTRPWVHVEALARFLRWHSPRSAALMIWFAHGTDDGWWNTQQYQQGVAEHYSIPAVSFLDWLRRSGGLRKPEERSRLLADDLTHPSAAGHRLAAALLGRLFAGALNVAAKAGEAQAAAESSPRELVTLAPFIDSEVSLPDDPHPLCVVLSDAQMDWRLAENHGFDWVTGGAHPAGLVAEAVGDWLALTFVTTQPHVEVSLGLYKSWQCRYAVANAPAVCPGDVQASLDEQPRTLTSLWTTFKSSVHVPTRVGTARAAGEHRVVLKVLGDGNASSRVEVRHVTGHAVRADAGA